MTRIPKDRRCSKGCINAVEGHQDEHHKPNGVQEEQVCDLHCRFCTRTSFGRYTLCTCRRL